MTEETVTFPSIKDVPDSAWEKLSKKKIFFGHWSVGNNILAGIKDLMKEHSKIRLNIVETTDQADFKAGLFAHSKVGQNGDPKSKTDGFANLMEQGIGGNADIAFFKFCFVDVDAGTDSTSVLREYTKTMSRLKEVYPKTTFIHVTVPLIKTPPTSPKIWIKELMAMDLGFFDKRHNIARNRFNQLLRNEYEGKEPLFDLAKVESTRPDGKKETFTKNGKTYYSLVPDYTPDAGHLNSEARKIIAEQLLILLANLSK